jgi:hypothetical protein
MEKPEQEDFDSVRLKRSVKAHLEEIQERVRQIDKLHKRPPLSNVVQRLIELAEDQANASKEGSALGQAASPDHYYNPENAHDHDLLEVILEGPNQEMKSAIQKNLRAFAFSTLVAGEKTGEQIDRDLAVLIKDQKARAQVGKKNRAGVA